MVDVDLVVVGGGMWGIVTVLRAKQLGIDVMLITSQDKPGASEAAAGLVCESWYKGKTVRKLLPYWYDPAKRLSLDLDWLVAYTGLENTGYMFSGYHREDWTHKPDCYTLPYMTSFLNELVDVEFQHANVTNVYDDNDCVEVCMKEYAPLKAKRVVLATGVYTDELLAASGYKPIGVEALFGRAMYGHCKRGEWESFQIPHMYMVAPYRNITIRSWPGNMVRIGSSTEHNGKRNILWDKAFRTAADSLGLGYVLDDPNTVEMSGNRPVLSKMVVDKISNNVVVATGGYTVALGMSPSVANRALELLS